MGFFSRLTGRSASPKTSALTVHAAGLVEVVGESYRQDVLRRVGTMTTGPESFIEELSGRARKVAETAQPTSRMTYDPDSHQFKALWKIPKAALPTSENSNTAIFILLNPGDGTQSGVTIPVTITN